MRFLFLKLPALITRTLFYLAVCLSPVLGVWLVSSLVAYINGPKLLTVFSGILLFPLVPILWDMRGRKKRRERGILTWGDRIVLRTLVLNLAFLFLLLALRPQASFLALSTRGDWFLDGMYGPQIELARTGLFTAARGLEGLYLRFHDNPFDQYADTNAIAAHQPRRIPPPTDDESPVFCRRDETGCPGAIADGHPSNSGNPAPKLQPALDSV
jgi:hypothetical protein